MNSFLIDKAKYVRNEVFKFKTSSGVGHLASCLSCVDLVVSIYYDQSIKFDFKKDYLIFSKAHGSPSVYPILADLNIIEKNELEKYCLSDGILRLHSDQSIPGCHFVGGSLGNGIGYASGLAKAQQDKQIIVILGDAELYEGSVWESLIFIAHHNLKNMTIIIDRNKYGILGATEDLLRLEPLNKKFEAFNFDVDVIDGHDFDEIRISLCKNSSKPKVIIANTIKGKGVSYMEDRYEYHTIIPSSQEDISQGLEDLR